MSHERRPGTCRPPLLSQEALALLEEHHCFPGEYTFKVIGFAGEEFTAAVQGAAARVLGPISPDQVRVRPSSGGRYVAVNLEVQVADSAQVLEVYAALRQVQGVVVLV